MTTMKNENMNMMMMMCADDIDDKDESDEEDDDENDTGDDKEDESTDSDSEDAGSDPWDKLRGEAIRDLNSFGRNRSKSTWCRVFENKMPRLKHPICFFLLIERGFEPYIYII